MLNKSTRGTSPGMMIYASDLMVKIDYRIMSFAERGLLFSMLCECWANGELPSGQAELSALLGKDVAGALTARVTGFFKLTDHETYFSQDIEDYRAWVVNGRAKMSEGGKKGAIAREKSKMEASKHPSREPSNDPSKEPSREASKHPKSFQDATLKGLEYEVEVEYEAENLPIQGENSSDGDKEGVVAC